MNPYPGLVTRDGRRLAAWSAGPGSPRVLVPNGAYYFHALSEIWSRHPAITYDLRNRGASDPVAAAVDRAGGVRHDVDDLDAVRQQIGCESVAVVAHSYVGVVAALYAAAHPARVERLVLLSPAPADPAAFPPPPPDAVASDVFRRLGELRQAPPPGDAAARCRAVWAVLAALYVADPALAPEVAGWGRCDLANERGFMGYWTTDVEPSLRAAAPSDRDLAQVDCPVLIVHGAADRSAPYAGACDWARRLPDARLLTLESVAHAPWLERPGVVLPALAGFLAGDWPPDAEVIRRSHDAADGRRPSETPG